MLLRWSHTGPISRRFFHSGDFWSLGFAWTMSPNAVSAQVTLPLCPSNSQPLNKAKAVQKPGTALAAWQALDVRGRKKDKPRTRAGEGMELPVGMSRTGGRWEIWG